MTEKWLPIPSFDGYEISNFGRIKSRKYNKPRIMKPWQVGKKYKSGMRGAMAIKLMLGSDVVRCKVHHLVLETFVGPAPEGHEGAHLDGDITNNRLDNLDWVTHKENEDHKRTHGTLLYGENATCVKLKKEDVEEIRELASQGVSHSQIARELHVSRKTVSNIINGVNWTRLK